MARRVASPSFVGRTAELAALREALERAAAGEAGIALVAGESGLGKSRLLAELAGGARDDGALVLQGDCIELGEGELPYAPVIAALRDLARAVGPGVLDELPPGGRRELARLMPELAPELEPVGAPSQQVLFEALLALLARLAAERPVLLVLEDVHWADPATRDVFAFLARSLRRERVLIVATYRSDELHRRHPLRSLLAEVERLPKTQRIELAGLSEAELGEQLAGILGSAPSPELVSRVGDRSEGNPFFAEELVAAGAEGPLPDSLRDALLVRIEGLGGEAQRLLHLLSAAGRPVPGALLAAAAELDDSALSAALREAVDHHVVSVTERDGQYRFRHALYAEAVYDDLLPGDRERLHGALAEALAADPSPAGTSEGIAAAELAHHWRAARRLPEALTAAVRAAEAALATGAPAEAARQFTVALEIWDQVDDGERQAGMSHPALLLRAGEAANLAADHDQAAPLLERAAHDFEAAGDPVSAGRAQSQLGRCLTATGATADGLEAHRRAVELTPPEPTAERANVLAMRGRALMMSDRIAESLPVCEEALAIARQVGDRQAEGQALNTIGVDLGELGDREGGIARLRESLQIAIEIGAPEDLASAYVNLGDQVDQSGRIDEAIELAIEGIAACERAGTARLMGAFLASEAALRLIRLGRYDEAEAQLLAALDLNPTGIAEAGLRQARAQLLTERGDPAAAQEDLEMIRSMVDQTNDSMWLGPYASTESEGALWSRDADRAARIAEAALARVDEEVFPSFIAPLYALALRAEAERREASSVASLRKGLDKVLTAGVGPEVHAWVALANAEARRAEGSDASEAFADAARRFDDLAIPFRAAYARMREAEAALANGASPRDVAERLGGARSRAAEIGAPLLLAEIEGLARRARVPLDGATREAPAPAEGDDFGLTPREREVLELLAEGHTNREIGERLYMSEKTASVHVSRILVKLSARNRGEAAATAHRLGLTAG